jgi:hypothetical protein
MNEITKINIIAIFIEIKLNNRFHVFKIFCKGIIAKIPPTSDPNLKDQPKMGMAVFKDHHLL